LIRRAETCLDENDLNDTRILDVFVALRLVAVQNKVMRGVEPYNPKTNPHIKVYLEPNIEKLIGDAKTWLDEKESKHDINGDCIVEVIKALTLISTQNQTLTQQNKDLEQVVQEKPGPRGTEPTKPEKFYSDTHGRWFNSKEEELIFGLGLQQQELNDTKAKAERTKRLYKTNLKRLGEGLGELISVATKFVPELKSIMDETQLMEDDEADYYKNG